MFTIETACYALATIGLASLALAFTMTGLALRAARLERAAMLRRIDADDYRAYVREQWNGSINSRLGN